MDPKAFYSSSAPPTSSKLVQRIENIYNAAASQRERYKNQQEAFDPFPMDFPPWKAKLQLFPEAKSASSRLLPSRAQTDVYELFYIQKYALALAREKNANPAHALPVHVFAYEHDDLRDGKRRFVATSYELFWHYYCRREPELLMHYEVIPEGQPVKLFFDLEFPRIEANRDLDGPAMVDRLIGRVGDYLAETYPDKFPVSATNGNGGNRELMHATQNLNAAILNNSQPDTFPVPTISANGGNRELMHANLPVLKLDASTPNKFSQHLIFPWTVFQDLGHAGAFVQQMCRALESGSEEDFFVWKEDGQKLSRGLCIDKAVYTRNRNLRLHLSRKQGKDNPLIFLPTPAFPDSCTPRDIFMASLVCNVDASSDILQFSPRNQESIGNRRLAGFDKYAGPSSPNPEGLPADTDMDTRAIVAMHSPFPVIDRFIAFLITRDGLQSSIRQCQYRPDTNIVVYFIQGQYRLCERIGRHHKSNNVYFVAHVNEGTYYQKCMDPDCRQFRSQPYRLPVRLTDSTSDEADANDHKSSPEAM